MLEEYSVIRRLSRISIKRPFDFIASSIILFIGLPLYIILVILIYTKLGHPILFRQQRPGLHGKPFTIPKFRTMTDAQDNDGNLLPNARRLTPFGRFLRSTSLDELPELFNVLKGDMSLVRPRPLLLHYLPLCNHSLPRPLSLSKGAGFDKLNLRG